jgi:hypothetical protein
MTRLQLDTVDEMRLEAFSSRMHRNGPAALSSAAFAGGNPGAKFPDNALASGKVAQ